MTRKTTTLRWWLFTGALLALVAGGVFLWPLTSPQTETASAPLPTSTKQPGSNTSATQAGTEGMHGTANVQQQRTPDSLGAHPFARSLQGTKIDGVLQADSNGNLIVNLAVRDFFDYFLNTVGEVTPETAIGQIQQMAHQHLPESAAQQALALLDQYLAYKQASLDILQTQLDPARQHEPSYQLATMGKALAQLKGLRQATFEPEAHQAFFGMEEAYSEYTLATMAIHQRSDLTDQGKQALVDWHRNQLPETLKNTEQRLQSDTRQHQERVQAVASAGSPEVAGQRLTELGLDQQSVQGVVNYLQKREAFDERFQSFHRDLENGTSSGLADAEQQQQHEILLEQYFPEEQERTWARLKLLDQG